MGGFFIAYFPYELFIASVCCLIPEEPSMSDKPISEKLQVKGARKIAILNAPDASPPYIAASEQMASVETADVVLFFAPDRAKLNERLAVVLPATRRDAILWLAYPKLTSKLRGDLSRDLIHDLVPEYGLDTISQIAIDDDWSALRLKRG